MQPLSVIFDRFMRLLPFLTVPNSARRFHSELSYPYPGVWGALHSRMLLFLTAPGARADQICASAGPVGKPRSLSSCPAGHHARAYLKPIDRNESGSHQAEPFW